MRDIEGRVHQGHPGESRDDQDEPRWHSGKRQSFLNDEFTRRQCMAGNLVEFTDNNFEAEALKANKPVLVDFWAPWCGPCRMVGPIIEELAGSYSGQVKVGKLNTDDNPNVASRYGIMSIPTILLFKNGEIVDRIVGAVPKKDFEEMLTTHT
jgi:thioredoxin 1